MSVKLYKTSFEYRQAKNQHWLLALFFSSKITQLCRVLLKSFAKTIAGDFPPYLPHLPIDSSMDIAILVCKICS